MGDTIKTHVASDPKPKLITRNPDGTYTRLHNPPTIPAAPDHPTVASKDITINATNKTWLRLFVPRRALDASPAVKLPLVVFYHGGGFVSLSAASDKCHVFCHNMADRLGVVVASVEYRLAPEHRLPAAYEDAAEALEFLRSGEEEWVKDFADVSNCFLTGSSAGANIAFHVGGRGDDVEPLRIKGLILSQPAFAGTGRTGSELKFLDGSAMSAADELWELVLPEGADRDHEYSNPVAGDAGRAKMDRIRVRGCVVFVSGGFSDPFLDRQVEFVKAIGKAGVRTVVKFGEGYHGMEVSEPSKAEELFVFLKDFITSSVGKIELCNE